MKTIDKKESINNESTWETRQNLDGFFSTLGEMKSKGISAIITKHEKKETDERDRGN